jgi:hypothetical protein
MSKKHQRTYEAIFAKPDRGNIDWDDFISLLEFLGVEVINQNGAARTLWFDGVFIVLHEPYPDHYLYKTDLKRIRRFISSSGLKTKYEDNK